MSTRRLRSAAASHGSPHDRQAADELRDGKFELADQHAARSGDGKSGAVRHRPPAKGEVGDQQGFAHFGFSTHEQDALRWQQSRFHQAGRRAGRLLLQKLRQRQYRRSRGCLSVIAVPRVVASSRIDSSTDGSFARGRQAQGGQGQLVDLAENAFGGLIEGLAGGVVKQRLGDAGGFELMREVGVEFLARETFQVILHGDALAQGFVHLQREGAAQQGLADQQQSQVVGGIHVEVEQQRDLFQGGMAQQLGFVADENGVLLLALVETHDGFGDLAHQVAAIVCRLQIQFQGQLAEQIQSRARSSSADRGSYTGWD